MNACVPTEAHMTTSVSVVSGKECPKCGTINGTRGLSCKNRNCDMIFKEGSKALSGDKNVDAGPGSKASAITPAERVARFVVLRVPDTA